jgi:hypothetical protein
MLIYPSLFGVGYHIFCAATHSDSHTATSLGKAVAQLALQTAVMLWGQMYLAGWKQQQRKLAIKWGGEGSQVSDPVRRKFLGTKRMSPKNNHLELYESSGEARFLSQS